MLSKIRGCLTMRKWRKRDKVENRRWESRKSYVRDQEKWLMKSRGKSKSLNKKISRFSLRKLGTSSLELNLMTVCHRLTRIFLFQLWMFQWKSPPLNRKLNNQHMIKSKSKLKIWRSSLASWLTTLRKRTI